MQYVVTGGAGFIGSHLVDQLVREGDGVVVIDDCSSGDEARLSAYIAAGSVFFYKRSILDDLADIFLEHKVDGVFHLAACPQVQYSLLHPKETHDINVDGTLALLEQARLHGVKSFVFASSSAVYGAVNVLPCAESVAPAPLSPYALHKLIGEEYLALYHRIYKLNTIALRFFNVYGPRQNPSGAYASLIPKCIEKIQSGQAPLINGDGEQTRDFVFVVDVVSALILAMSCSDEAVYGGVFNVGGGTSTSVNAVVNELLIATGADLVPVHGESVIEPRNTCADISLIKTGLAWQPTVSLKEGIAEIVRCAQR